MNRQINLLLITGLMLLAVGLRVGELTRLPPGFNNDEFVHIRITESVRHGDVAVYYQVDDGPGRAGMYAVGNALATELVGDGLFGYRVFPFWCGLITLALLYALARRLFGVPVALVALGVMSVNLRAILLARTTTSEAIMPAYVLLTLLCLTVAFHLRREVRFRTPATLSFALLAVLLGIPGYLHYTGLVLGPLCMLFVAHLLYTRQPLSRRLWSTILFVMVLATIIALPYLISTLRDPRLSEVYTMWAERPHSITDGIKGVFHALSGVIGRGDARITHNLPQVALVGPGVACLLIVGVVAALRRWREPGYALILLMLAVGLLTDAWVGVDTTYSANLVALPAIYILSGIGALALWQMLRARQVERAVQIVMLGLVGLLIVNVGVVRKRIFNDWKHHAQVTAAYHANLGYLAAYLDRTPDDLPVSFCATYMKDAQDAGLSPRQQLQLMLHREDPKIRYADCRGGLVLINAGAPMRFAFADVADRALMPPELAGWLADGIPITVTGLPDGSVLQLDVEQRLQDAGGAWDALALAYFMPEGDQAGTQVQLPITLEQNLTFAGYDPRVWEETRIAGGDPVVLVTYWRVDGPLPPYLGIFAHVLGYSQNGQRVPLLEPWAEANVIDVIPSELDNRDFFVQVLYIWLNENLSPDDYALTVGAYVDTVTILENHLAVLDHELDFQPHGDRLLLGDIQVEPAPETDDTAGDE